MQVPPNNHSHLWNDLPEEERHRLMPHMIEAHIHHVWQCKYKAVRAHQSHMKELNDLIAKLELGLNKLQSCTR